MGKAVLEAILNDELIYDLLGRILDDVALAHPLKIKATAVAKINTDKISADVLADLPCSGLLPKAYAASSIWEIRDY